MSVLLDKMPPRYISRSVLHEDKTGFVIRRYLWK